MKHRKTFLFGIILVAASVLGPAQQVIEEIVAIVNDEAITLSAFRRDYEERLQAAQSQLKGEELDKAVALIKKNLLDEMITDMLLLQMARAQNFNVTDRVKMAVENIKKANNIDTDDDFKRALAQQGYEVDAWLKVMEERIMRDAVLSNEVGRKIVIDDAEIVDYYKKHQSEFVVPEEYQLQAVYLKIEGVDEAAIDTRKKEIDAKLKSGTAFPAVAESDSDEPLKEAKGDLGSFKKAELDKTLLAAVEKLTKGEVSSWVQTKNGWYLLRLADKKDSRLLPFDEARGPITEKVGGEKQAVEIQKFLTGVKKTNFIKILKPNPLDDKI